MCSVQLCSVLQCMQAHFERMFPRVSASARALMLCVTSRQHAVDGHGAGRRRWCAKDKAGD